MNPDVFITIVFVGIAVLFALVSVVFVVPSVRREELGVARRDDDGHRATPQARVQRDERSAR